VRAAFIGDASAFGPKGSEDIFVTPGKPGAQASLSARNRSHLRLFQIRLCILRSMSIRVLNAAFHRAAAAAIHQREQRYCCIESFLT